MPTGAGDPGTGPDRAGTAARPVHLAARLGYVARGLFYALLAYLVVRIATLRGAAAEQARDAALAGSGNGRATGGSGGRQVNAEGALSLISQSLAGTLLLWCAAAGFLTLAAVRLTAAWRDRRPDTARRLSVAGQGLCYIAVGLVPINYLRGNRAAGSESQQHDTAARLLGFPGGGVLVVLAGLVMLAVCGWQLRGVLRQDFTDGLVDDLPQPRARWIRLAGSIGIVARAVVFGPIGIFLIVAGLTYDPRRARGLDGELLLLAGSAWGSAVLLLVAAALAVFALYSLVEARYRDITRGV
ncbi:DUF1206 domain-containing protein [Jatrophihabitans sp.]|uniref:DUF1206 domain-containing protein n=1 Tax=Jatrophihabitans sp. TaxID=1932789 RepID=UPI002C7A84EB|nr:DUF1206 domain-containing protein [Jatrophihabitans sp.]